MSLLIQGGGFSIGPNGVCWDCPISLGKALQLLVVVVVCVALGIWLRHKNNGYVRNIGNFSSCLEVLSFLR